MGLEEGASLVARAEKGLEVRELWTHIDTLCHVVLCHAVLSGLVFAVSSTALLRCSGQHLHLIPLRCLVSRGIGWE